MKHLTRMAYAELQSHWDAKGIEQEFDMLPGTRLTFILRYKGRYDGYSDSNPFKLKVEGAHEVLVNGQPAQTQGSVKQESFMADDEWDKYAEWHYASVAITADPQATTLVPITLTLIPEDVDEAITYGGFVDLLPADFKLKDLADVAKGWDDTGNEPWTSVGVGKTKSIVKFVGGNGDFELVVAPGSASYLSISNETVTGGDTNFTITGTADSKNLGADGAKIIFRKKATTVALATLHVHVLATRVIHYTVFHASDEGPGRVPLSAIPAGVVTPESIGTELNNAFRDQAYLDFIPNTVNPVIISNCDGCFVKTGDCYYGLPATGHEPLLAQDHIRFKAAARAQELGINTLNSLNILIVKNVIRNQPRLDVDGLAEFGNFFPFVDAKADRQTFAHETGHGVQLSSRTDPTDDIGNHHDPGPDPHGNTPLMGRRVGKPRSHWMRQEDWRIANEYAGANYH